MKPKFLNPCGYSLIPNLQETIKQKRQVYTATINEETPLMFFDGKRKLYMKGSFSTDLGSIPAFLQGIPGLRRDDWEISYLFHDRNCSQGGLWFGMEFVVFSREEADALLFQMIKAEAELKHRAITGEIVRPLIWVGVRIGAFFGIGVQTNTYTIRYNKNFR